jgi:CRP-like cAMP-binding protein
LATALPLASPVGVFVSDRKLKMEAGLAISPAQGAEAASFASFRARPKARSRAVPTSNLRKFAPHEAVFREGDRASALFRVAQGAVMVLRTLSGGRRQILDIAGPGRLIGLTAAKTHDCSAIALKGVVVEVRDREKTMPHHDSHLAGAMFDEIHRLRDLATALGRKTAAERLASFLLALTGDAVATPVEMVLPVSRQEIADHLGLAIETVCRNFTMMKRMGLVRPEGNYGLTICNLDALRQISHGADGDELADGRRAQRA